MGDGGCYLENPPYPSLEGLLPLAPHCKWECTSRGTARDMGEYMDPVMNLVEMGQTPNKVLVDPDRKEAQSNFGSSPGLGLGRQYTGGSGWAP